MLHHLPILALNLNLNLNFKASQEGKSLDITSYPLQLQLSQNAQSQLAKVLITVFYPPGRHASGSKSLLLDLLSDGDGLLFWVWLRLL